MKKNYKLLSCESKVIRVHWRKFAANPNLRFSALICG